MPGSDQVELPVEAAAGFVVMAPNGVAWKRHAGCTSSASEFLAALDELSRFWHVGHQWNWWQEGRRDEEHDRLWKLLEHWDHAAPPVGGYLSDDEVQARLDAEQVRREEERALRAARYDEERAAARIRLLSEAFRVTAVDVG